jgi:hypothetical protein
MHIYRPADRNSLKFTVTLKHIFLRLVILLKLLHFTVIFGIITLRFLLAKRRMNGFTNWVTKSLKAFRDYSCYIKPFKITL